MVTCGDCGIEGTELLRCNGSVEGKCSMVGMVAWTRLYHWVGKVMWGAGQLIF